MFGSPWSLVLISKKAGSRPHSSVFHEGKIVKANLAIPYFMKYNPMDQRDPPFDGLLPRQFAEYTPFQTELHLYSIFLIFANRVKHYFF